MSYSSTGTSLLPPPQNSGIEGEVVGSKKWRDFLSIS